MQIRFGPHIVRSSLKESRPGKHSPPTPATFPGSHFHHGALGSSQPLKMGRESGLEWGQTLLAQVRSGGGRRWPPSTGRSRPLTAVR